MDTTMISWYVGLLSAAVSLTVALIVHALTRRRDLANRRQEQRVQYLVESFIDLLEVSNQKDLFPYRDHLRRASSKIQLFGTPRLVEMMGDFVRLVSSGNKGELDPLLEELRDQLRKELGEASVTGPIWWIDIYKNDGPY